MGKNDLVIIVDENDREIDRVPRWQADQDLLRYRITNIWIENSRGQVLIAQRGLNKTIAAGLWGPAASGTVEADQSYYDNAIQEVREELGIESIHLSKVTSFPYSYPDQKRFLTWFRGTIDTPLEDIKIEFPEVNAVAWIDKTELFDDIKNNPKKYVKGARAYYKYFSS